MRTRPCPVCRLPTATRSSAIGMLSAPDTSPPLAAVAVRSAGAASVAPPRRLPLVEIHRAVRLQYAGGNLELPVRHLRVDDRASAADALDDRLHVVAGEQQGRD